MFVTVSWDYRMKFVISIVGCLKKRYTCLDIVRTKQSIMGVSDGLLG